MICDAHNDFPTVLDEADFNDYIKACETAGVEILVASIFTTQLCSPDTTVPRLINKLRTYNGDVRLLIHIEDLGFLHTEDELQKIIDLKPFSCGLTWNHENTIATKRGLTKFGRITIKRLRKAGILIDLAHTNERTFWQAAKKIKKNLYVSHAGFAAVHASPRNLTDRQALTVFKSGGFIGLFFVNKFLYDKNSINSDSGCEALFSHIAHAQKLGGAGHIGIGSDFFGSTDLCAKNYSELKALNFTPAILSQNFVNFFSQINH